MPNRRYHPHSYHARRASLSPQHWERRRRRETWRDAAHISDMIDAARLAISFVGGKTIDDYLHDPLLRSAVERQIEIIGEACRQISDTTIAANPEVPWRQIIAQRHRLAHEYGEVNDRVIWEIATQRAPDVVRRLERILADLPPGPG